MQKLHRVAPRGLRARRRRRRRRRRRLRQASLGQNLGRSGLLLGATRRLCTGRDETVHRKERECAQEGTREWRVCRGRDEKVEAPERGRAGAHADKRPRDHVGQDGHEDRRCGHERACARRAIAVRARGARRRRRARLGCGGPASVVGGPPRLWGRAPCSEACRSDTCRGHGEKTRAVSGGWLGRAHLGGGRRAPLPSVRQNTAAGNAPQRS